MVQCVRTPCKVKDSWLAKLAVPQSILFDNIAGLNEAYIVFDASEFSVVVWPVVARMSGGQKVVGFDASENATWKYIHVLDLTKFVCQEAETIPPGACKDISFDGGPFRSIRKIISDPKVYGYLRFSALHCFPLAVVPDLKRLVIYIECPCEAMPTNKAGILHMLLEYILPDKDDVQIAAIMELDNCTKPVVPCHSVVSNEGLDGLVDDVVDPDTKHDIIESAKAYAKSIEKIKLMAVPKAKPKVAPGAAHKKKKKVGAKDLAMVAFARKYLPIVAGGGCTLTNETEWHTRYKVEYPSLVPGCGSTSASYEEDCNLSKRKGYAVLHCLGVGHA